MAAQSPSAERPHSDALASTFPEDSTISQVNQLKDLVYGSRSGSAAEALAMLELGAALHVVKKQLGHGKFGAALEKEFGINRSSASKFMKAAKVFLARVHADVLPKFLALGKAGLLELVALDDELIVELAQTGDCHGVRLDDLSSMTVTQIRAAVRSMLEDDGDVMPLIDPPALRYGDRVCSIYARRPGRVVSVYPDGSACVCWDDGEPQEEGLGHERVPRKLLVLVGRDEPAAVQPPPAGDGDKAPLTRAEVGAILRSFASKAGAEQPAPTEPDKTPADDRGRDTVAPPIGEAPPPPPTTTNVICLIESRLRAGSARGVGGVKDVEKIKAYCSELLDVILAHASPVDVDDLMFLLEEQVAEMTGSRALHALTAARYALYCRFWIEGGAQ